MWSDVICTTTGIFLVDYEYVEKMYTFNLREVDRGFVGSDMCYTPEEAEAAARKLAEGTVNDNPLLRYAGRPLFVAYEKEEGMWSIIYGNKQGRFDDTGLRFTSQELAKEAVAKHEKSTA